MKALEVDGFSLSGGRRRGLEWKWFSALGDDYNLNNSNNRDANC
jgi:hypothetical protein